MQRAAPDGYTVLFHASSHNVAKLVLKNSPYDPVADFTPSRWPAMRRSCSSLPTAGRRKRSLKSSPPPRTSPNAWSFATAQLGSPGHLAAVAFNQFNGLKLPIIVYRGTAPAANESPAAMCR